MSQKYLLVNVTISPTQTIGPRNRVVRKKRVSFAPSATQKIARKKVKKYRRQRQKKSTNRWQLNWKPS